jgi:hypothetical protein
MSVKRAPSHLNAAPSTPFNLSRNLPYNHVHLPPPFTAPSTTAFNTSSDQPRFISNSHDHALHGQKTWQMWAVEVVVVVVGVVGVVVGVAWLLLTRSMLCV